MGSLRSLQINREQKQIDAAIKEEPVDNTLGPIGVLGTCHDGLGMPKIRTLVTTNTQQDYGKRFLKLCDEFEIWEHRSYVENSAYTEFFATKSTGAGQHQVALYFHQDSGFSGSYLYFTLGKTPRTRTRVRSGDLKTFEAAIRQVLRRTTY
jgi:hypothetical protein